MSTIPQSNIFYWTEDQDQACDILDSADRKLKEFACYLINKNEKLEKKIKELEKEKKIREQKVQTDNCGLVSYEQYRELMCLLQTQMLENIVELEEKNKELEEKLECEK